MQDVHTKRWEPKRLDRAVSGDNKGSLIGRGKAIEERIKKYEHLKRLDEIKKETRETLRPYYSKATPGKGKKIIEEGFKISKDKDAYHYGERLYELFGGSLTHRQRSNTKRKSDYEWNGKYWEHKHVSSLSSADDQAHSCLGQIAEKPGGMIVQLTPGAYDIPLYEIKKAIWNRLNRSAPNRGIREMDVFVFKDDNIVMAFRWK